MGDSQAKSSPVAMGVLLSLSLAHLFNDMFQSIVSAVYPILKENLSMSFGQIGLVSLVYQICASVFQPVFGVLFDKNPRPWYLSVGTLSTMAGLTILAFSGAVWAVVVAVIFMGLGSSVIHPEASRLTHYASAGRHGLAQSIFQVGGNFGTALGPLLAALIIAPYGQRNILIFTAIGVISLLTKAPIIQWYRQNLGSAGRKKNAAQPVRRLRLSKNKVYFSLFILLVLIFSKYVYQASLYNYYTFYLIEKFDVTTRQSQFFLFAFLFACAAGTLLGGPLGDRYGRKYVIWFSILGTAPFSLLMPYVGLWGTCALSILIGLILSSAFSAILVYAQELLPTKVGLISGLFFGVAFGIAGIAAAVMGKVADVAGIEYVYRFCSYAPLLGLVAVFLPNVKPHRG